MSVDVDRDTINNDELVQHFTFPKTNRCKYFQVSNVENFWIWEHLLLKYFVSSHEVAIDHATHWRFYSKRFFQEVAHYEILNITFDWEYFSAASDSVWLHFSNCNWESKILWPFCFQKNGDQNRRKIDTQSMEQKIWWRFSFKKEYDSPRCTKILHI